jgi:hypothetical protein
MFASSPALSAMDHPVYDLWVLDCENKGEAPAEAAPAPAQPQQPPPEDNTETAD